MNCEFDILIYLVSELISYDDTYPYCENIGMKIHRLNIKIIVNRKINEEKELKKKIFIKTSKELKKKMINIKIKN